MDWSLLLAFFPCSLFDHYDAIWDIDLFVSILRFSESFDLKTYGNTNMLLCTGMRYYCVYAIVIVGKDVVATSLPVWFLFPMYLNSSAESG